MAEVSGFLTNNDLFRTRLARTLDLYSRDSLSSDLPHDEHESNLDDNRNLDLGAEGPPFSYEWSAQVNNTTFNRRSLTTTEMYERQGHGGKNKPSSDIYEF